MSLTKSEQINTKKELNANFNKLSMSVNEIAHALQTTPEIIEKTLNLKPIAIEDTWILLNFMNKELQNKGIKPVPYSRLNGDYHRFWFLNSDKIDNSIMSK